MTLLWLQQKEGERGTRMMFFFTTFFQTCSPAPPTKDVCDLCGRGGK